MHRTFVVSRWFHDVEQARHAAYMAAVSSDGIDPAIEYRITDGIVEGLYKIARDDFRWLDTGVSLACV